MGAVEQPQIDLLLAGVSLPCMDAEISLNNQLEAGRFSFVAPVPSGIDAAAFWAALEPAGATAGIPVEIRMAIASDLGAAPWVSLLSGSADRISCDPLSGLIEVEGRDALSRLIALPVGQNFVNNTASEIVAILAEAAGLSAVITPTASLIGQFYQIEHAHGGLSTHARFATAWDLVSMLAQEAGYDCWAAGQTLFFQPQAIPAAADLVIDLSAGFSAQVAPVAARSLRLDRRTELAAGKGVQVTSWNSRQRCVVSASYPPAEAGSGVMPFRFVAPNLDDAAALAKATALYGDISRHRQVLSGEMGGDLSLMPRSVIRVVGSSGPWNGTYLVDSVVREISARGGFSQSFVAHLA